MGMRPVPELYRVTQSFRQNLTGYNVGAAHGAIDFGTPSGTPVVSPENGTIVAFADWAWNLPGGPNDWALRWFQIQPKPGVRNVGGGILTVLRDDLGWHWIMAHLSSNDEAKIGSRVRKGQIIGRTGNTGSSTGPHLHLALIPPNPNWNNRFFGGVDPAPYITERYAPLGVASWSGGSTAGTGSSEGTKAAAPQLWIPGATRRPQTGGVRLDVTLPPRATWHITSDVDPGKQQPPIANVVAHLERVRFYPHVIWDPFTGEMIQWLPANVGGCALKVWNEDGRVNLQVEILFSQGAIRDGRRYDRLDQTPLKGFDTLLQWIDGWGIPRTWPMGPTPKLHTSGRRDPVIWNTKAGHYGHSQVPGNDHSDPGVFPDIASRPRAASIITQKVRTEMAVTIEQIRHEIRGSINDLKDEQAAEVGKLQVPAKGDATGTQTLLECLGWERHSRVRTEALLLELTAKVDALAARLDAHDEQENTNG